METHSRGQPVLQKVTRCSSFLHYLECGKREEKLKGPEPKIQGITPHFFHQNSLEAGSSPGKLHLAPADASDNEYQHQAFEVLYCAPPGRPKNRDS